MSEDQAPQKSPEERQGEVIAQRNVETLGNAFASVQELGLSQDVLDSVVLRYHAHNGNNVVEVTKRGDSFVIMCPEPDKYGFISSGPGPNSTSELHNRLGDDRRTFVLDKDGNCRFPEDLIDPNEKNPKQRLSHLYGDFNSVLNSRSNYKANRWTVEIPIV